MAGAENDHLRRRVTDVWPDERISDRFDQIENQLTLLAPVPTHIAQLEVKLERTVSDLGRVPADLSSTLQQFSHLLDRLEKNFGALDQHFVPRVEMPALYVPRSEHERKGQLKLQWPLLAFGAIQALIAIGTFALVLAR